MKKKKKKKKKRKRKRKRKGVGGGGGGWTRRSQKYFERGEGSFNHQNK
jgi:hypothetical protein